MGFLDKLRGRQATLAPFRQAMPAPVVPVGQPHFAVIDVETTGLVPAEHRIVEIAVVTTDPWGRVLEEWGTRVNPEGPVGATQIHHISQDDVANAPTFPDVIAQLNQRLAGAAVVAHHASFDVAFLRAEYERAGWDMPQFPVLCTQHASEYYLPGLERRRLGDCCWAVGTPLTGAHSALGDARATATLLSVYMHPHVGVPPLAEHAALPGAALAVAWPASAVRARNVGAAAGGRLQVAPAFTEKVAPAPALVNLVARFSLVDALDEGAPAGTIVYLEKMAEVLEDGVVTAEEAADLAAVADAEQLSSDDVLAANQALVLALAHAALEDGHVSHAERAELHTVSGLLGVNEKVVRALLERAEVARNERMSAGLARLPEDWAHGEPLRVGDKVVFTGCESHGRPYLEAQSEKFGVRIVGGVSAKTAMLVTDGTMDGTKAAKARDLSTRLVHPDEYAVLLTHLQPALARDVRALPKSRPVPAPKHAASHVGHASPEPGVPVGPDPALVRAWARANGFKVGTRGRLHRELIDAYLVANTAG